MTKRKITLRVKSAAGWGGNGFGHTPASYLAYADGVFVGSVHSSGTFWHFKSIIGTGEVADKLATLRTRIADRIV
jgi:hypothetical protein